MDAKDWRFPMDRPDCHAGAGFPFRAVTKGFAVTLYMRCLECQQEWSVSATAPLLVSEPAAEKLANKTHVC